MRTTAKERNAERKKGKQKLKVEYDAAMPRYEGVDRRVYRAARYILPMDLSFSELRRRSAGVKRLSMKLVLFVRQPHGESSNRSVFILVSPSRSLSVSVLLRLWSGPSRLELEPLPPGAKGSLSDSSSGDEWSESSSRMRFFPRAFSLSCEDGSASGSSSPSEVAQAAPAAVTITMDK